MFFTLNSNLMLRELVVYEKVWRELELVLSWKIVAKCSYVTFSVEKYFSLRFLAASSRTCKQFKCNDKMSGPDTKKNLQRCRRLYNAKLASLNLIQTWICKSKISNVKKLKYFPFLFLLRSISSYSQCTVNSNAKICSSKLS